VGEGHLQNLLGKVAVSRCDDLGGGRRVMRVVMDGDSRLPAGSVRRFVFAVATFTLLCQIHTPLGQATIPARAGIVARPHIRTTRISRKIAPTQSNPSAGKEYAQLCLRFSSENPDWEIKS
ncbi:MAG: hypothetical protein MJE12_26710, partial [Alphaproteobacteria bacterium]|nr:hypothetical protein [Alphaproteobacteria bacterium]